MEQAQEQEERTQVEESVKVYEEVPLMDEHVQDLTSTPPSGAKGKERLNEEDILPPVEALQGQELPKGSTKDNKVLQAAKKIQLELHALIEAADQQSLTLEKAQERMKQQQTEIQSLEAANSLPV